MIRLDNKLKGKTFSLTFMIMVALMVQICLGVTTILETGTQIKPNNSASGYYYLNKTIVLDELEVNDTYATFRNLDSENKTIWDLTNHVFISEDDCENCSIPQTSTNKELVFYHHSHFNLTEDYNATLYDVNDAIIDNRVKIVVSMNNYTGNGHEIHIDNCGSDNITFNVIRMTKMAPLRSVNNVTYESHLGSQNFTLPSSNYSYNPAAKTMDFYNLTVDVGSGSNKIMVYFDPGGTGGGGGGGGGPLAVVTEEPYCGDGICGSGETFLNCPSDCETQPAWAAKFQFLLIGVASLYTLVIKPSVVEKKRQRRYKKYKR